MRTEVIEILKFEENRYEDGGEVYDRIIFTKDVEIYTTEEPHNSFDIYDFDEAKEVSVTDEKLKGDILSGTILGESKGHYIMESEYTSELYYMPNTSAIYEGVDLLSPEDVEEKPKFEELSEKAKKNAVKKT